MEDIDTKVETLVADASLTVQIVSLLSLSLRFILTNHFPRRRWVSGTVMGAL